MNFKHGSLFSGQGGFDLASQWMGWNNVFHCENNPFCTRILKYYWPGAISYGDIKTIDFTVHRGSIDVLTGGFPCQPYSQSGKRKGKADERHLWPEMLRAIREVQPRWIVGENVRGLTNWNAGLVFDEVQTDLETAGYEVTPFLLPAAGVNAPHERYRIWFVAYSTNTRIEILRQEQENTNCATEIITDPENYRLESPRFKGIYGEKKLNRFTGNGATQSASYTNGVGLWGESNGTRKPDEFGKISASGNWENFPTQSPICFRNDGISTRLDGITFSKWRNESIKAAGNAVVPQIPYQIFKAIESYEQSNISTL